MVEERGNIYSALGVALIVGGLTIGAESVIAIANPPKGEHPSLLASPTFWFAVVLLLVGVYVLAAAQSETLPLPGMKAARERSRQHGLAVILLTLAMQSGVSLNADKTASTEALFGWWTDVATFLAATWGRSSEAVFRAGTRHIGEDDLLEPFLQRLEGLLERAHSLPLDRKADPVDVARWVAAFGQGRYS